MSEPAKFQIFKREDQYVFGEEGVMTTDPTPVQKAGLEAMLDAGVIDGSVYTMVANLPGFTLMHAWFKKDYPLPLHSHDADCLYYIIAGSLRLGTEELGPRDSFFIPADVPYTYRPGPDGVEVLEIRQATHFNFVNLAKGAAFWDKAAEIAARSREEWKTAARPPLNVAPAAA